MNPSNISSKSNPRNASSKNSRPSNTGSMDVSTSVVLPQEKYQDVSSYPDLTPPTSSISPSPSVTEFVTELIAELLADHMPKITLPKKPASPPEAKPVVKLHRNENADKKNVRQAAAKDVSPDGSVGDGNGNSEQWASSDSGKVDDYYVI